jgi:nitrite reductase (NADH) small subunit
VTPVSGAAVSEATNPAGATLVWVAVCRYADLQVERGAAALVGGTQVAVFRLADGSVAAIGNQDPFSGANVLSRGLVGTKGDVVFVASPMYKQRFDLRTGDCLDDAAVAVPVHAARVEAGRVEVAIAEEKAS